VIRENLIPKMFPIEKDGTRNPQDRSDSTSRAAVVPKSEPDRLEQPRDNEAR